VWFVSVEEYERRGRLETNVALLGSGWCAERRRWFAEAQSELLRLHVRSARSSGIGEGVGRRRAFLEVIELERGGWHLVPGCPARHEEGTRDLMPLCPIRNIN
jgi:hypothetical protein